HHPARPVHEPNPSQSNGSASSNTQRAIQPDTSPMPRPDSGRAPPARRGSRRSLYFSFVEKRSVPMFSSPAVEMMLALPAGSAATLEKSRGPRSEGPLVDPAAPAGVPAPRTVPPKPRAFEDASP